MIHLLSALYMLTALVYLAAFNHNASWLGAVFKCVPILLLAYGCYRHARGAWRVWGVLALLFSALGDALLAADGIRGHLFVFGIGAFLVAQLLYAQLFWRHRSAHGNRRWIALAWLPMAIGMAWFTLPGTGELLPAVAIYSLGITAMVTGAAMADRPLQLLFAGAVCFAFSDGLIAVNRFVEPVTHASLAIMLSYYVAQWLLWRGIIHDRTEAVT